MAAISISKVLANSRVSPPSEIIALENVLKTINFAEQVIEWASQTGAGTATYSGVGVARDLPLAETNPQIVATISCEKTPNAISFASWISTDALTWTYTTATKEQIIVKVEPRDTLRRLALIGSCVTTEISDTEAGKAVSLQHFTLGLMLRQRLLQGAIPETKWTVLVSHAFATKAEIAADKPQQGVSRHDSWKLKVCSGSQIVLTDQCADCTADQCVVCKPSVEWAAGEQDIVRSMTWDVDVSLVRLPQSPTPAILPLDIKEFVTKTSASKSADFVGGMLQDFVDVLSSATLTVDRFATPDFIRSFLLKSKENGILPYAFKKGSQTSWSWGVITKVNDHRVWMRSLALDHKKHLLVDSGDCGSIWFVIDDLTNPNAPVIIPMAVECLALKPELNHNDEPDMQCAGADFYSTALRKGDAVGDYMTLSGMIDCAEDDLYFAANDSFTLTA